MALASSQTPLVGMITSPAQEALQYKSGQPLVIDLCSGLGGLSLAARTLGMKIVAGVDCNAHALKTFTKNFSEAKAIEGSIRSKKVLAQCAQLLVSRKATPACPTVVVSGPPCQGFSMAGPRHPGDPRNQIIVAAARAIVEIHPTCALIENVSMVLASKHDDRLSNFEKVLVEGGYHVTRILLDASEFGVPQKRKRAFFLITRKSLDREQVLKKLEIFKREVITTKEALTGLPAPTTRPDKYNDELDLGVIPNHVSMQHSKRVMKKISKIAPGTGPMSYRRLHPMRPSNTLFSGHRAPPAHFQEARSITVREAARLQGFPDEFRIYGPFGSQMEQVTNAVPPALARAVLRVLLEGAEIH